MVSWVIPSQGEIYVPIINCRDRVSSVKNNHNKTKCNMDKAIPYDQLSSKNSFVFPFLLPRKPFPCHLFRHNPFIVRSWKKGGSHNLWPSNCVALTLSSLHMIPKVPWTNCQIPVFSSVKIKVQESLLLPSLSFSLAPVVWSSKASHLSYFISWKKNVIGV